MKESMIWDLLALNVETMQKNDYWNTSRVWEFDPSIDEDPYNYLTELSYWHPSIRLNQTETMSETNPVIDELTEEKLRVEIRKLTAEAERHEYEASKTRKDLEAWNASSDEHRIYNYFGGVDAGSAISCMDVLGNWSRRQSNGEFTIIFNSPGGSVIHGLALYDFLIDLRQRGHKITTVARGMAASMGGILLQAGDRRLIGQNAHMLIHEVSTLNFGKISEIEDELKFTKRLQDRCLDILADRSTLSKAQIKTRWARKDWWLSADETIKFGFADEIG